MKPSKLKPSEFDPYFNTYIKLVDEIDIVKALKRSEKTVLKILKNLPKEKHEYCYAEGKWTMKELLLHLIDTERIFVNRALRFARKDEIALPSFAHNDYVENSHANNRKFKNLIKEYKAQRKSSILFFKNLNKESLKLQGIASEKPISVRALGYIIAGHDLHHCSVIQEKYM